MSRRLVALVVLLVGCVVAVVPGRAHAHTGFESSNPAEGETVDEPVATIVVTFTGAAEPVGEGFVVLDPQGAERMPDTVDVRDGRIFELGFDPPLTGSGPVGVRWEVVAPDSHPISGSFAFLVDAPIVPTTVAEEPETTDTSTTTVPPASAVTSDTAPPADAAASADASTTSIAPGAPLAGESGESGEAGAGADAEALATLEEFLAAGDDQRSSVAGDVGRTLSILAGVLGVGALAALVTGVVRGGRDRVVVWRGVSVAGGLLVAGAVAELAGLSTTLDRSWTDVASTSAGVAVLLRAAGGLVLLAVAAPAWRRQAAPGASVAPALSAATLDAVRSRAAPADADARSPWLPPLAALGAAAILISFWFDGHTASEGPRVVHALVNTVHVAAGAVWAGGVVTMAAVAWTRARAGRPSGAGAMIVRFSSIATVALVAVVVAGVAMAVLVLDSPGDLTSTEWGRVLLLKSAFVAVAAAIGGYNHVKLRPAIADGAEQLDGSARTALTIEAIVLSFVLVATGTLVASSLL